MDRDAPPAKPLCLGVLGGIASGKSAVARLLAGGEGEILDADRLAREALGSEAGRTFLLERFGPEVLTSRGEPDREALAALVFSEPDARADLEGWIHPRVRERIRAGLEEARARGARRVVLDVPLLLENNEQHGLADLCDFLIFVDSDPDERDARARERRGWSEGEVARREAAQLSLEQKRERAHFVIVNRGTLEDLDAAVRDVLDRVTT